MVEVGGRGLRAVKGACGNVEAVAQGAGDDDGVEAGELVGQEVEVGDAAAGPEVARVGACVQGPDGHERTSVGPGPPHHPLRDPVVRAGPRGTLRPTFGESVPC